MEYHPHSSPACEQLMDSAISTTAAQPTAAMPNATAPQPRTTGNGAAKEIGQAYDGIHRLQAILAYIKIMNRSDPGLSPILNEAKHTYEQAFSLYEARDFEGALEFASASRKLSQALEIVISRALRSDSLYPTLVLLPPEHQTTSDDSVRMQEELYRVECLLFLIRRVAKNGTLLFEEQAQTLNIASCSERLLEKARHLFKVAVVHEAIDLVHAAAVTARAAQHVCKRSYSIQGMDPF